MVIKNILANVVVALVICLTMLLFITARLTPPARYPIIWQVMVMKGAQEARLVNGWFAPDQPPTWVKKLAVVWNQAQVITWWWLPLVFFALRWFISRWLSRKRARR